MIKHYLSDEVFMVKLEDVKHGDTLVYDNDFFVTFLHVEDDKVVVNDPVLGDLKVLISIFEKNYSFLS